MEELNVTAANTQDEQGRERFFQYPLKYYMVTNGSRSNLSDTSNVISSFLTEPFIQVRIFVLKCAGLHFFYPSI